MNDKMTTDLVPTMDVLIAQHVMKLVYDGYCRRGPVFVDAKRNTYELGYGFSPSQNIGDAMTVVNRLAERHLVWKFDLLWEKQMDLVWFAHALQAKGEGAGLQYRNVGGCGKTPEMAICFLALEAVRDKDENAPVGGWVWTAIHGT